MARNLATSLRLKARNRPMDRYDRLPHDLRQWLTRAALPWSPQSVLRLWGRELRAADGDVAVALARLDLLERQLLAKDGPRIWGEGYPVDAAPCQKEIAPCQARFAGVSGLLLRPK